MKKIPVKNCLKCVNYDACEDFEDGDCPLAKQSPINGLHMSHGLIMTVDEWAKFLQLKPSSIKATLIKDKSLDNLFAYKVERELKKLEE
jgi:hypothetical protein